MPNIIVVGDIMLDINNYTHVEKLANEAPIPVFNFARDEKKLGGCGNVLQNLRGLGCAELYIFSCVGDDENGTYVSTLVDSVGAHNHLQVVPDYVTTTKIRYFADSKIMFRCDVENSAAQKKALGSICFADAILELCKTTRIDCIVLSDYNKGVLHTQQCKEIIAVANSLGIMTCVDPKNDYMKYTGCTLIKPNRHEAYALLGLASIDALHRKMVDSVSCKYSVITLSEDGISLFDGTAVYHERPTIHSIVDVTGAGDVVCSVLAFFLCQGSSVSDAIKTATQIATFSVEHPGTYVIQPSDLHRLTIKANMTLRAEQLGALRELYPNKKIAFTNGCYDLFHTGHLSVLEFCKGQADIVVVGINSDASVKRLKGPTRPIHNQETRAAVVLSNKNVDYVVVFEEDTPLELIRELRPDYLIKGGDYTIESIVGREYAKETLVVPLVAGVSTSNTIASLS
jgi:D-beta-D-heptose 7-phosphate kinase/D-beta-D-heptose 1-phosphate adenosyltransferase